MREEIELKDKLQLAANAKDAGIGDHRELEVYIEVLEWALGGTDDLDIPECGDTCPDCGEWKPPDEERYEAENGDTICGDCKQKEDGKRGENAGG